MAFPTVVVTPGTGQTINTLPNAGQATAANSLPVVLASDQTLPLPTGASTEATLATLNGKIPALGQALAAASAPVVLTAAQITTLAPLANVGITGTAAISAASLPLPTGAALEAGNLATIVTNTGRLPAQGQALAAASLPVVLTAAQLTTLTPPASVGITGTAAVSAASLPLPTGASTETTLAALNTKVTAVNTGAVVLAAGSAKVGVVTTDQTTHGTTDLVAADITKVGGAAIALGQAVSASSLPVVIPAAQLTAITAPTADVVGSGTIVSSGLNNTYTVNLSGTATATFAVSGLTASGATLTVEASDDAGTTWATVNGVSPATHAVFTTLTTDQQFRVNAAGRTRIRLRVSIVGTGTITVASNLSTATGLVGLSGQLPTGTNNIGSVQSIAGISGGATPYILRSAATTNATSLKASAGNVYSLQLINRSLTANAYFNLFDKASAPTVGTDTPVKSICIPAAASAILPTEVVVTFPMPIGFALGIAFDIVGGTGLIADTATVALNDVTVNVDFK